MNNMRKFIFRGGSREIVLPVTPPSFEISYGQGVQHINIHELGDVVVAGKPTLATIKIDGFFPAQPYPFAHYYTDPYTLVGVFQNWIVNGEVVRFIIPNTAVNMPVMIESISLGEQDGSNDVYYTLTLVEYKYLEVSIPEEAVPTTSRAVDAPPVTAQSYTVAKGDTLASIARKFYGDSSLAYKLATANGISNPNLIKVGQVLTIPDKSTLMGYEPTKAPKAGEEVAGARGAGQSINYGWVTEAEK